MSKIDYTARLLNRLSKMGFSYEEAKRLLRIERTLHRWAEMECGDGHDTASWAIKRDEETGVPYKCVYFHDGRTVRYRVADRETAALKRLQRILDDRNKRSVEQAGGKAVVFYHQTDPRGCALYLLRTSDIPPGSSIDSCYTNGLAVCI